MRKRREDVPFVAIFATFTLLQFAISVAVGSAVGLVWTVLLRLVGGVKGSLLVQFCIAAGGVIVPGLLLGLPTVHRKWNEEKEMRKKEAEYRRMEDAVLSLSCKVETLIPTIQELLIPYVRSQWGEAGAKTVLTGLMRAIRSILATNGTADLRIGTSENELISLPTVPGSDRYLHVTVQYSQETWLIRTYVTHGETRASDTPLSTLSLPRQIGTICLPAEHEAIRAGWRTY